MHQGFVPRFRLLGGKTAICIALSPALLTAHVGELPAGAQMSAPQSFTQSTDSARDLPIDLVWGAYVAGAQDDPAVLDRYAQMVGEMPRIVLIYQSWEAKERTFPSDLVAQIGDRGAVTMMTWDPGRPGGNDGPSCRLSDVAKGSFDTYLTDWLQSAGRLQGTILVRLGHEMNGDWQCWAAGRNGNTAKDFVAAWRHIVDLARSIGTRNIEWVWSPNVAYDDRSARFAELYPGDDVVDWVAVDGYNWGTTNQHRWQSFTELFGPSLLQLSQLTTKPLMIAEVASAEQGGDKAEWITSALTVELPALTTHVSAVVWFDANKESDWRVSSSESALRAFVSAIRLLPGEVRSPAKASLHWPIS